MRPDAHLNLAVTLHLYHLANMSSSTPKGYRRLLRCPSLPNGLTFATYWHRFAGIPDFYICSKCYADHIAKTPLATLCEIFYDEPLPGTASSCDLNHARMKQIIQDALRSGDSYDLLEYAQTRDIAPPCKGATGELGGKHLRWWSPDELWHEGFVACDSCDGDWLAASPFRDKFHMRSFPEHKPEDVWVCDLATPYVRRTLQQCQTADDWQKFIDASRHAIALPACSNSAVKRGSKKWFRPAKPYRIVEMMVCEKCLLDNAGGLPIADNFEEVKTLPLERDQDWICDFQTPSIRACTEAVLEKDYNLWHTLASEIMSKPVCAHGAVADADWYVLPDPESPAETIEEFDICAACYIGHFKATKFARVLMPKRYPAGKERICDFSPLSARSEKYLEQWNMVLYTGDPSSFTRYVKSISFLPVCSRSTSIQNRRWYGMDDFFFCQSCYEELGRGSYFASSFTIQNRTYPQASCDMYTDNMRRRYIIACRERNLIGFLAYCKDRVQALEAYNQNIQSAIQVMRINNMRNMNQIALSTAMTYNSMGHQQGGWRLGDLSHMPSYVGANMVALRTQDAINRAGNLPPATPEDIAIRKRWTEME